MPGRCVATGVQAAVVMVVLVRLAPDVGVDGQLVKGTDARDGPREKFFQRHRFPCVVLAAMPWD
jgi:hypothetical protein